MRYFAIIFITIILIHGCKDSAPDVSGIKIDLKLQRFEDALFNMDSIHSSGSLDSLLGEYKGFGENFLWRVLQADPQWKGDTLHNYINGFIKSYRPIYDSIKLKYPSFEEEQKAIERLLKYVKYYFPNYRIPEKLITYLGPLDGYGDLLDTDAIVVGLQHHLGSDFAMYQSELVSTTYPAYISRRFTKEYIEINAASNIVSEIYQIKEGDYTLIEMMVQQGKRLYIMKKLLPQVSEDKIIGFSKDQWEGSEKREDIIWAFFLQNNLLQSKDINVTKNYIGDSPKTQELGDASPGNIGAFCGWKIVESYMNKNSEVSLERLIATPDDIVYRQAKYKP